MKRGDVVTVAAAGDYGKPRPAVIVQTDALPETHASVVICQMTSEIVDAPDFRVTIDPTKRNGLRVRSRSRQASRFACDCSLWVNRCAAGAFVARTGRRTEIGAPQVILSGGTYGSPAILMRLGI